MDTTTETTAAPEMDTTTETTAKDSNEGTVDESNRYKGTVQKYEYRRGFGLITPEDGGKPVYVHWKQIESADDWPALKEGMKVEYYLGERTRGGKGKFAGQTQKFAAKVTLEGGTPVSVSADDLKKVYPDRSTRFTGTIKFFHGRKGYGFVKPKEEIKFADKTFKPENPNIYIAREDIKTTAETAPVLKDDQEIEFALYKREKADNWGAGDVTLPGGEPFTAEHFGKMGPRLPRFNKNKGGFGPMKKMGGQNMMMMPMNMQNMMMMNQMMPMMMGNQMMMMMPAGNQGRKGKKKGTGGVHKW